MPMYDLKRVPSDNPAVNTTIVQPIATHQRQKSASVRGGIKLSLVRDRPGRSKVAPIPLY
jgi:hypothetical protein